MTADHWCRASSRSWPAASMRAVVASAQHRLIHSERDRPAVSAALSMRARRDFMGAHL
ncbi:hypothetical protein HMPREF9594_01427 [Cutibacterium acnes HL005PA1]|nr:hypothetical protein HMPREF9594_01427 [Cutibacterium acnes HL005PA1]